MSDTSQSGQPTDPHPVVPRPSISSSRSLTPILGRDEEIDQVLELLDGDSIRILTLMGPGGVGKTRLAHAVVERAGGDFAHGACFVPLASILDPALVPTAVLLSLGSVESAEVPSEELLKQLLREEHRLLVLDNLEHLVESASPWLADLVANCPRLKVLVTSRVALNVAGEQRYSVLPLAIPDAGVTATPGLRTAAIELFTQRAHAIRPDLVFDANVRLKPWRRSAGRLMDFHSRSNWQRPASTSSHCPKSCFASLIASRCSPDINVMYRPGITR